jgi:hypothetical protein
MVGSRPGPGAVDSERGGKTTVLFYVVNTESNALKRMYHSYYQGGRLPVLTSPESSQRFRKAYAKPLQKANQPVYLKRTPFELALMTEYLEAKDLDSLYFDPLPDWREWGIITGSIPFIYYRRAIEAIRPEFEKLDAEAMAQFCRPSHLHEEPFVRWRKAGAEDIAADLRARIEEWTAANGY